MVGIVSVKIFHMQRHAAVDGKSHEPFLEEFGVEGSHLWCGKGDVPGYPRTVGKVHNHTRQRLIQGNIRAAKAGNPLAFSQRFFKSLSQGDADIFDGMMVVDMGIPTGGEVNIKQAVPCQLIQHMVEKTDTAVDAGDPGTIQVEGDRDLGFGGFTFDGGGAFHLGTFQSESDTKLMCGQPFGGGQSRRCRSDGSQGLGRTADDAAPFDKIVDPQRAGKTCRLGGR